MNHKEQCETAARLAKTIGAKHEPGSHGWRFEDETCAVDIVCVVGEDGAAIRLEIMSDLAAEILETVRLHLRRGRGLCACVGWEHKLGSRCNECGREI